MNFLLGTVDELTPWYGYYREKVVSLRPRTEYETFGHPVACMSSQLKEENALLIHCIRHACSLNSKPRAPERICRAI